MRRVFFAIVVALPAALSSGCVATAPASPTVGYPSQVLDFGQDDRFPKSLAGYRRGVVTAYAPALADYSVAYDRDDAVLQNAVTLYLSPRRSGDQLEAERSEVMRAHRGAVVRATDEITLQGRGGVYNASLVTFEYDDTFAGRPQRVSSQLLLVLMPTRTFKARSTAPVGQAGMAESGMLKVVEGTAWAP